MDTYGSKETELNIRQIFWLIIKSAVIILSVSAALYGLNMKMSVYINEERAAERAKEEKRRLQEDYDRANEDYEIIDHYDGQFQEIFEKRVNADYIFLGTSHITHGVTPEEFEKSGKKFFNFALNGSNPSYYVWWYNSVFKPSRYVKPKAIIFGVDWFMFDTDWLWRRPEFDYKYLRESRDPPNYGEDENSGYNTSETASDVYKFRGKWYNIDDAATYVMNRFPIFSSRSRFIEFIFPEKKQTEETEEESFIPEKKEKKVKAPSLTPEGNRLDLFYKGYIPWEANFTGHNAGNAGTSYKPEEKKSFISLLDQFEEDGIPVVFVMAPEYLPGRNAPQFERMLEIISEIATERNIPFLNYNTDLVSEINYDYTCYSDWGHLNDKGAHLFSQNLYGDLNDILKFDK